MEVVPLAGERFADFISLVNALADYEHLERPSADAVERLREAALGERPRIECFLAVDGDEAVGYAITLETFSSFLAKPTMYLEDLFVLEGHREKGAGSALFDHVLNMARERDCGRMEWQVLDWNNLAREFYHRRNAEWMEEWLVYRITL
jgi:GNAT superfamily N-acetyltransferase